MISMVMSVMTISMARNHVSGLSQIIRWFDWQRRIFVPLQQSNSFLFTASTALYRYQLALLYVELSFFHNRPFVVIAQAQGLAFGCRFLSER